MPPKKGPLADAWDDDWETIADKEDDKPVELQPEPELTRSQLKAKHAELNKQIWESADNPEPQYFAETRNSIPVQPTFKPKVTMLARKPSPQVLSRNMAGMNLDDDDSEEERKKKAAADFEERKARAQRERAEKERKYAEARERIFGSPATSATEDSRSNSPSKATRGKGRGRGGRDSQPRSSNEQSPARAAAPARQLFDPTYASKPGSVYIQKKDAGTSRPATPNGQEKPVRQPQGPARGGGRGFASRGGLSAQAGPSS
ncbi:Nn.00g016950.m01.CDS01 [Neocucurbitaria sp. VM-36]